MAASRREIFCRTVASARRAVVAANRTWRRRARRGIIVLPVAGLAGIRPRAFLAAVALGALPKTIAYVALGGALSDPLSMRGAIALALYTVAAVSGALVARRLVRSRPTPAAT